MRAKKAIVIVVALVVVAVLAVLLFSREIDSPAVGDGGIAELPEPGDVASVNSTPTRNISATNASLFMNGSNGSVPESLTQGLREEEHPLANPELLKYENTYDGVIIMYPSTWEFILEEINGELVEMIVPSAKRDDYLRHNVRVSAIETGLSGAELDEYVEGYLAEYRQWLATSGWSIVSERQIGFLGGDGVEVVAIKSLSGVPVRQLHVYGVRGSLIFEFNYISSDVSYDSYAQDASDMLDSYEISSGGI